MGPSYILSVWVRLSWYLFFLDLTSHHLTHAYRIEIARRSRRQKGGLRVQLRWNNAWGQSVWWPRLKLIRKRKRKKKEKEKTHSSLFVFDLMLPLCICSEAYLPLKPHSYFDFFFFLLLFLGGNNSNTPNRKAKNLIPPNLCLD